jgi:hypothetical protein
VLRDDYFLFAFETFSNPNCEHNPAAEQKVATRGKRKNAIIFCVCG